MSGLQKILIDNRNFNEIAPQVIAEMSAVDFVGLDIETQDEARHDGLNAHMGNGNKKLVFDTRRTTVTGFSIYPSRGPAAYYVNLAHADEENRLPWEKAKTLLDAKPEHAYWIAHNAPFEIVMLRNSLNYDIWPKVVCTLQMCVSAYSPDEYPQHKFLEPGLGEMNKLIMRAAKVFAGYDRNIDMTPDQSELMSQLTAKESKAAHSWNGYIKSISYGYDLKKAVKSWFNYDMATFKDTLNGRAHMGELTGDEVVSYGADDAFWAVALYERVMQFMLDTNPQVVTTFFKQELPMVGVYADTWQAGMKVNLTNIQRRQKLERYEAAEVSRRLKAAVRKLLPFPEAPHASLERRDKWYAKNWASYRARVTQWAEKPDVKDDYEQLKQISGAVIKPWVASRGEKTTLNGPNVTHYMVARTLIYDLMDQKLFVEKGKTQSDGEARGKMALRIERQLKEANDPTTIDRLNVSLELLTALGEMAGIEQRMKLYITPYSRLTDPDTERMYPVLSSMQAARRMSSKDPNPMQLAKRGESTYVRDFYEGDNDEHLVVSLDWSGVELVIIGDQSGDPEFAKAFGQLPYEDLHGGAAADILDIPEADFKAFSPDVIDPRWFTNLKGEVMSNPGKAKKYWRTEVGKGANFNYWYSGALWTVAERLGWGDEKHWDAVERYRNRFGVAEEWRLSQIDFAARHGYVQLPDGHRRTRFEVTPMFRAMMNQKFQAFGNDPGILALGEEVIRRIQSRAKNQSVNSLVQGTCSTLAKRSIPRIIDECHRLNIRARFMIPIHDELVFSVHHKDVQAFIEVARRIMADHSDIVKTLPLHCTASVGRTFVPYSNDNYPFGQIELDEAPDLPFIPSEFHDGVLPQKQVEDVIDYLMRAA